MDSPAATPPPDALGERRVQVRALMLLLMMVLILAGSALYLMWARGAFEATQPLYLSTDDSDGVLVGMDMTFAGFPIGRVRKIALAGGGTVRIQVDVPVKDAHWLRVSSVFTLERGLVGAARLRAFTGVPDDAPLPAGAERVVLRGDVSAEVPKMVSDARDLLQNLGALTSDQSALAQTLIELRGVATRANQAKGGLMAALTGNEADARRLGEALERSNRLLQSLEAAARRADTVLQKADRQVLGQPGEGGQAGLVGDARAAVGQLDGLLKDLRHSVVRVDAVLTEVQGAAGNARSASEGLGNLRADVEASLAKVDALITELNRQWPFAPKDKEVTLP